MSFYPLEVVDALLHPPIDLATANTDQVQALVAAKQGEDEAAYTALYRQIIAANDWPTLLAAQAALEAAGLAAAPDPRQWTCPCCGRVVRRLVDCDWCEWDGDPADNEATCAALDQVQTGAGYNACIGHGCMVCQDCRPVFYGHPEVCPVQIMSNLVSASYPFWDHADPARAWTSAIAATWDHPDPAVTAYRERVFQAAIAQSEVDHA